VYNVGDFLYHVTSNWETDASIYIYKNFGVGGMIGVAFNKAKREKIVKT